MWTAPEICARLTKAGPGRNVSEHTPKAPSTGVAGDPVSGAHSATAENVLGVLSLIIYSLLLVISIKYIAIVMRADNHGEGGILALTALLPERSGAISLLVLLG